MIQINQIKLRADEDLSALERRIEKMLHIGTGSYTYRISKKSIDARKKDVYVIYNVIVSTREEDRIIAKCRNANIMHYTEKKYSFEGKGTENLTAGPIVVGSGPAGLFCSYMLAKEGYSPLIIERGSNVELRRARVDNFWKGGILDTECNVQFGEGGAGTFSDGKLNTLVKDKMLRNALVLDTFVKYGANDDILYDARPHIGTDILFGVLINMREDIIKMGGRYMFDTRVVDLVCDNGEIKGVMTADGRKIMSNVVVLAIGHSSRDTFTMINEHGIKMLPKSFAVGVRVEHHQRMIQVNQYKDYADYLAAASYKLAHQCGGRGVYSFCMCPGGYVVNASSEKGMTAVNGMSYSTRDSGNANSAIVVTVTPQDFGGDDVLAGIRFQRRLEEAAYTQGRGDIPVQLLGDFRENKTSTTIGTVKPRIKGKYTLANLNNCLPKYVCDTIVEGMTAFDARIPGFGADDTVLSGVESRTSSPVRIVRDDESLESVSVRGLYPCGEGAGYAGGIMSAAMDGIKVFEAIVSKYRHPV